MGRAFWWISAGIMLVVFMPIGILLLGIVIIREVFFMINGDVEEEVEEEEVEEEQVKKKSNKKFKSNDYSEEVLSGYR